MITYDKLAARPSAFQSLLGLRVEDFETLYPLFEEAWWRSHSQQPLTKRTKAPRKRAMGAGRRYALSLRDRLVIALVWLRIYPTYEALGFFFDKEKSNARANVEETLDVLLGLAEFGFERPSKERKKLHSVAAVMEAFPDVALIIDAKEQRVQRPSGKDKDGNSNQKPFYSGKKKAHTLKNQVAVRPDGFIEAVSESVPGSIHDLTLLRQTKLVEQLKDDEGGMFDKGYDGITNDFPNRPLSLPYKARRNHPLSEEEKAYNRFFSSHRIVVEHTNAQLQKYQALAQLYRHDRDQHSRTIRVVALLINRQIAVRPLKDYSVTSSSVA